MATESRQSQINRASALAKSISSGIKSLSSSEKKKLAASTKENNSVEKLRSASRGLSSSSSRDSSDNAITPDSLDRREVADVPTPTVPVTQGLNLTQTNAGLGAGEGGLFEIPTVGAEVGDTAGVTAAKDFSSQLAAYLGQAADLGRPDAGASEDALADSRRQAGVDRAQQEFNRYSGELNAITAQRDADQLGLEGQGRGITDTIIGGQQARIGREAAIRALPVQAQLAAAQGNLEQAQALMGQLYQAKSADIAADQNYRSSLASSMMQFATASQQAILQAKQADIAQNAATAQNNLAYQRQLGLQALEYGQQGLITGISNIDPSSPTFEQDIAAFTSQLRKPVAAVKRSTQVVDVGGAKMLVDTQTGEVIKNLGGGDGSEESINQEVAQVERVDFVDKLTGLTDMPGFNSAVGPIGLARFGVADAFGAKDEFIGTTENIIKTLTLNSFAEAKERGMTFGAMSEGEWKILGDSATALSNYRELDGDGNVVGYDVSEKGFKREVNTLTNYAKLDAIAKGTPAEEIGVSVLVNPQTNETEYWSLNSFGQPTLIR